MNPRGTPERNRYCLPAISFRTIQLNDYKGTNLQFKPKEELSLDNKDTCILDNMYAAFFRQKNDPNKKPYFLSTLNALAYHLVDSKYKKNIFYVIFNGNTPGVYASSGADAEF
jgi:hypothetical protein